MNGRPVVDEDYAGVAATSDIERLAGADSDDLHADVLVFRKPRQQIAEQARLLGRRHRRDSDSVLLSLGSANQKTIAISFIDTFPRSIRMGAPLR